MAYDIGPRIGIDGEAEFRQSINQMTQNLKTLGTEMGAVTSAFGRNDKSQEALTAQNEVLTKQITVQKEKLDKLKEGLAASAEKYGENDERTLKWQAAVNSATAQLNGMERQLRENNDELEKQGNVFDKVKEKMASFGSGLGGVMKTAAAGVAAFATASAAAATAIGAMVSKAAYAADDINTLAKQTGLSTEEIQKFQFASEQIDVSLDTLTGSMSKMTKNMATASKGTGDAYNAFKTLGVEITNQDGTLRDRNEVFNEAIDALGRMENETQRDAYAMQIFGKSAQDLNPLILGGSEALKELGDQAEAAGVILSQDSLDTLNLVSDAIDTFKATASGAGNLFSVGFAEPIAEAINTVTGYITRLTSAFNEGGMAGLAEEMGGVMTDMMATINEYIPKIIQFGSDIVTNLITGLVTMLPDIAQTAVTVITQLADSLSETLPELIPVAVDAILTITDSLLDNLDQLVDAALKIITALAFGLIDALPKLAAKVPEIIMKIVTVLATNLPKIAQAAVDIIGSLIKGLIRAIPTLAKNIPQLIKTIVTGFTSAAKQFMDIGKNIVTGVWDGIKAMATWIKDKVTGFFGGIVSSVKGLLGIHSPSKVFAGIGEYMAQGLGVGFEDQVGSLKRSLGSSLSDMMPSIPALEAPVVSGGYTVQFDASMLADALSGMSVFLEGRKVGKLVLTAQRADARSQLKPSLA